MPQEHNFIIKEETGRLDKVLTELLPSITRSHIQQWIKEGNVTVNGENLKANYKVQPSDEIVIIEPELVSLEVLAEDIPIEIVYQDEDVVVVNKAQGMVVHPSAGHQTGTLVNALMYHIKDFWY